MSLGHPAGVPAKMPFSVSFSKVNNRKSLGHRPVDPCLSRRMSLPVLPFLDFLEKGREHHPKNKDFYPYRTPKIPGKEGKNAQKNKEILARRKNKEFKKNKEGKDMGHTPSTAGTFRKKFRKNSGKTPETLSERFLEFPSRVRLGCPKPYNSRHLKVPEHFQNSLPPVRLGTPLFSEVVPERASQSRSWNSQQYWGYFRRTGQFRTPSPKVREPHFLWFGLPEPLLILEAQ